MKTLTAKIRHGRMIDLARAHRAGGQACASTAVRAVEAAGPAFARPGRKMRKAAHETVESGVRLIFMDKSALTERDICTKFIPLASSAPAGMG
jgi:hypothetical protein